MREVGVADQSADAKAAVGKFPNGVEADAVDVDELGGAFDVEFHQVEKGGASGYKADVFTVCGGHGLSRIGCAFIGEEFHGDLPVWCRCSGALADVLDGGDDVGICAATTDIAAHQFLDVGIGGAAWLFEQSDGGHDLAGRAVAALVAVVLDE